MKKSRYDLKYFLLFDKLHCRYQLMRPARVGTACVVQCTAGCSPGSYPGSTRPSRYIQSVQYILFYISYIFWQDMLGINTNYYYSLRTDTVKFLFHFKCKNRWSYSKSWLSIRAVLLKKLGIPDPFLSNFSRKKFNKESAIRNIPSVLNL